VREDLHDGRAVRVDPIKPVLNAPGTKRLNLKYDEVLSNFAFKFNLRRYMMAAAKQGLAEAIELRKLLRECAE